MQQLDTRLRECYNELSPQEQRVASFIMDHFDDLMSYNSAELARLSGVSKATVSRLFKRLGYDRFKEMRDEVRTLRQSGMPLTENRDAVQGNTLLAVVHGSSARYWRRCTNRACRLLPSANRRRRALPRLPAGTSACRSTAYRRSTATAVP